MTAPYPCCDASEKWCSWLEEISPKLADLKQRSISSYSRLASSCNQACQQCRYSAGILSSHLNLLQHRSCRISFALSMNGPAKPGGSYMELTIDRMPLLVTGLSLMTILKPKWSEDTFHRTPSALSTST